MNKTIEENLIPPLKSINHLLKIMNCLLLMVICSVVNVYADNSKVKSEDVTLSVRSESVQTVLNEIERQTGYLFMINSNVDTKRVVSLNVTKKPVREVLNQLFRKTGVHYAFEGRHIILSTNASMKDDKPSAVPSSQNRSVKGRILDEDGQPLIGANVRIKGTDVGVITDIDGNYTLSSRSLNNNSVIEVSYVGMKTSTAKVGNRTKVDLVLSSDSEVLDEVVVVGYGTQKKINLTGAVSSVDVAKQLEARPITDIARGLQGSAPGLTVRTSTGEMGTDPSLKIRGVIGSTNGSSAPLILVDNVECNSLQNINPEDVESISVLKDAASASIYGVKAAFGVVLVTTKKAKKGEKFSVNYSNNFSWKRATVNPEIVETWEGAEMSWAAGLRSNPNLSEQTNSCYLSWNLESIERMKEWERVYGGMNLSPEMVLGRDFDIIDGKMYFYRSFDAPGEFIKKNSFQQTHNLSFSGSSGNTAYNLSMGYLGSEGIIKVNTDQYDRFNVSFGTNTTLNKYVDVRSKLLYTRYEYDTPYNFGPSSSYDEWYYLYRWPKMMPYGTYQGIPFHNVVTEIQQANMNKKTNNYMRVSLGSTVHILPGFDFEADYTFTHVSRYTQTNGGKVSGWNFWGGSGLKNEVWTAATHDKTVKASDNSDFHVLNALFRYNKEFGKHTLGAIAGTNVEVYQNYGNTSERRELILNDHPELPLANGDQFASSYHSHEARLGYFARINYTFMDRYLLEVNGRLDGSSSFPSDQLWGFFPSASAGWIMSEENFMQGLKPYLSTLKFRGSWGQIGNQDVGTNMFRPILSPTTTTWIVGTTGERSFGLPRAIADGFTWETITTADFGIDTRFFDGRLGVSFDWFQRRNTDMITSGEKLPATFGQDPPMRNFGELTTKGWELSVDFRHRFHNGLGMSVSAYISDAKTKYTKINSNSRAISGIYEGKEYGEIWGFETDRFFTADDFETAPDGKLVLKEGIPSQSYYETNGWFFYGPGDIKYKDLNGDGKITPGDNTVENPGDQKRIGNSTPRYEYGARLDMDWKGFDLGIFIQGVGKRELWGSGSIVIPGFNYMEAWYTHQLDYWTPDNPDAFYPAISNTGQSNNTQNFLRQTKYLLNMAYCRVKNVSFGYTFPEKWMRKAKLSKLRLYVSLENLFEFDHLGDIPIDPETQTSTGDGGYIGRSYPYSRSTSFGMQLTF